MVDISTTWIYNRGKKRNRTLRGVEPVTCLGLLVTLGLNETNLRLYRSPKIERKMSGLHLHSISIRKEKISSDALQMGAIKQHTSQIPLAEQLTVN